jgi:hypothetical protein
MTMRAGAPMSQRLTSRRSWCGAAKPEQEQDQPSHGNQSEGIVPRSQSPQRIGTEEPSILRLVRYDAGVARHHISCVNALRIRRLNRQRLMTVPPLRLTVSCDLAERRYRRRLCGTCVVICQVPPPAEGRSPCLFKLCSTPTAIERLRIWLTASPALYRSEQSVATLCACVRPINS